MRKLFPLLVLSLLLSSNAAVAEKAAERGVNSERLMLAGDRPDPSITREEIPIIWCILRSNTRRAC